MRRAPTDDPALADIAATTAERRIGAFVHAAAAFDVRRMSGAIGTLDPDEPVMALLAVTDTELYLLETTGGSGGVGGVICRWPRRGLVAACDLCRVRRRTQAWRLELSWPDHLLFVAGDLGPGDEADRLVGLLIADLFSRQLRCADAKQK